MQIKLNYTSRPHKYNKQAELNRDIMAHLLTAQDYIVIRDGDCYLVLDCFFVGKSNQIRQMLQEHGIKVSKQPNESFLRLSTLSMTKQGWKEEDFKLLAEYIIGLLKTKF